MSMAFAYSLTLLLLMAPRTPVHAAGSTAYTTKSRVKQWVDPATPAERQVYTSSRGRKWELVMSDEFNTPDRSFKPGEDHLWTSIEKPDGVNGALELYSHNMTSTTCDSSGASGSDTCYLFIKVVDDVQRIRVFNAFVHPPAYETARFFYRSGMLQSWNKFCFQGGMLEARVQLPGAVSAKSGNPDLPQGKSGPVRTQKYYPTWPGIWMMGNLGRAIFSASTNRMWPFSYDRCEPELFDPANQRISACDPDPGFGLNKHQGRGAPEIDLLEGSGSLISSSVQIAPGMPADFRVFPVVKGGPDELYCIYTFDCKTPGANNIDVPTAFYQSQRGHKSWYQGLRYAANNYCTGDPSLQQSYSTIAASLKKGIVENVCSSATCPGSLDVNADLGLIDGVGPERWGINSNGSCFPKMNSYTGAYLCDPDNTHASCSSPRNTSTERASGLMEPFNYQMDAISANWPVHLAAYLDYLVYQLEWVTGANGYVRWMLDGHALFEITADAFSIIPQDAKSQNLKTVMIEEPMSLIVNVALSRSWGTTPPNPGQPCRGENGTSASPEDARICDEFPMFMKVDYIRLYQEARAEGDGLGVEDDDSLMSVGCDPKSHPTKEWINGHLDEYQDAANPAVEVAGRAFCRSDDDCTVGDSRLARRFVTGSCDMKSQRCQCLHPQSWGGPRCTVALAEMQSISKVAMRVYGPPMALALVVAGLTLIVTLAAVWLSMKMLVKQEEVLRKAARDKSANADAMAMNSAGRTSLLLRPSLQEQQSQHLERYSKNNLYHQNFV
ncbi:hypothetical protein Gpo141_00006966 [Globisporangium polare]